jgi:hypothetical protein
MEGALTINHLQRKLRGSQRTLSNLLYKRGDLNQRERRVPGGLAGPVSYPGRS